MSTCKNCGRHPLVTSLPFIHAPACHCCDTAEQCAPCRADPRRGKR